jgi:tRNA1(Val) A37 N6-methylase TrmN6
MNTGSDATTVDAFLGGAVMLRQPKRGYRAGIDPVLLAAACNALPGVQILDCGAGVGTVGLCVARRMANVTVTLLEREPVYAALARDNIAANGLADRATVIEADLTAPLSQSSALTALIGTFDHALANPPYMTDTDGTRAPDPLKDAANAMPADGLDAWARAMAALVRPGGTATIIHRADALPSLFAALDRRFGGLVVRPIHPNADAPANRVLVRATKGSRAPLTLASPLVVHDATGAYAQNIVDVLRHGAAISL